MVFQSFWKGHVVTDYKFSKILSSIGESRDERWSSFNTSVSVSIDFIFWYNAISFTFAFRWHSVEWSKKEWRDLFQMHDGKSTDQRCSLSDSRQCRLGNVMLHNPKDSKSSMNWEDAESLVGRSTARVELSTGWGAQGIHQFIWWTCGSSSFLLL